MTRLLVLLLFLLCVCAVKKLVLSRINYSFDFSLNIFCSKCDVQVCEWPSLAFCAKKNLKILQQIAEIINGEKKVFKFLAVKISVLQNKWLWKLNEKEHESFLFIQYFETKKEIHFYLFKRAKLKGPALVRTKYERKVNC